MNKPAKLSILTAVALSLTSSVALADDPVAPRPVHQEQNISQINGQLVEVGSHSKFDYSYKRFNVAGNPLSAMVGIFGFQGSMAISSTVAIRGDLTLYDLPGSSNTGVDLTGSAAIYFKHMYQGLFLEPGLLLRSMSSYGGEQQTSTGVQTLVGYHWMWDSGLNAAIAMGVGRKLADDDQFSDDVYQNGYVRFGYAF